MNELFYAGADFVSAVSTDPVIADLLLLFKLLILLVSFGLVAGIVYVLRKANFIGLHPSRIHLYIHDPLRRIIIYTEIISGLFYF